MDLVYPEIGLVFWTTVSFLILLVLLRKFAWKPILEAINERERSITDALSKAEAAKEEMSRLVGENEDLLKQARAERDEILKEARMLKDKIVGEAKDVAQAEGARMMENARLEINMQKALAIADVKNQVATLSIEIAEKVLRKQFEDAKKQDELVTELLREVKL
jgi:F-type H+-transporting ATPase subunit b